MIGLSPKFRLLAHVYVDLAISRIFRNLRLVIKSVLLYEDYIYHGRVDRYRCGRG